MNQTTSKIHIGTSGWNYKHWKGPFYPKNLSSKEWFAYYAKQFQTVEINNTFYRLPERKTFMQWQNSGPDDFFFSVKANRYITHIKKLKDPHEPVANFMDNVRGLGEKMGPILFQLPPRWHCNPARLKEFFKAVPKDCRCVFEFRDESWWDPHVYEILRANNAAFCIYELAGHQSPLEITADFVYIRLHGPEEEAYRGNYNDDTLAAWAASIQNWASGGLSVYCYFDNDENGYAPGNALRLQQMIKSG